MRLRRRRRPAYLLELHSPTGIAVAPELAGAFLNLEPLVGTAAGALAFGDPFGPLQLLGGAVILARHRALAPRREAARGGRPTAPGVAAAPAGAAHRTRRRQATPSRPSGKMGTYVSSSTPRTLSPHMTLLAPRPDRTLTPHTFVVPVVRELPSPDTPRRLAPSSSAW